jgi:Domain of unknown function (DUF6984)
MSERRYRQLTDFERRLVLRLFEPTFAGRDELLNQVDGMLACTIDENGSLDLLPRPELIASVEKRVPSEGEAVDADGIMIHYLLHVVSGRLKELEIYKEDSSKVVRHPDPDNIDAFALD